MESKTPNNCTWAPAGLVSGPRRLKIVLNPNSFLTTAACFIALCINGAKRKPIPTSSIHRSTVDKDASIFIPKHFKTSALPDLLETARFPCFATVRPAPATTNATAVEILKVSDPSPPVPQVSMILDLLTLTFSDFSRITFAAPAISGTVSFFTCRAVKNAASCISLTAPSITWVIASTILLSVRSFLAITG